MAEAKRVTYTIDGRYMEGTTVTAYRAVSSNNKKHKIAREKIYGLIKAGQITNMEAATSNGKVILKGKGISLKGLPVLGDKGTVVRAGAQSVEAAEAVFTAVGRCMNGTVVSGYVIMDLNGNNAVVTPNEVRNMIRARQIDNLFINNYQGKALIRGKGIAITDLPVYDNNTNSIRGTEETKKNTNESSLAKITLTQRIMDGNKNIGFACLVGGVEKKVKREKIIELALANRISNARANRYNGKVLLRGVGVQLENLPVINIREESEAHYSEDKIREAIRNNLLNDTDLINKQIGNTEHASAEMSKYVNNLTRAIVSENKNTGLTGAECRRMVIEEIKPFLAKAAKSLVKPKNTKKLTVADLDPSLLDRLNDLVCNVDRPRMFKYKGEKVVIASLSLITNSKEFKPSQNKAKDVLARLGEDNDPEYIKMHARVVYDLFSSGYFDVDLSSLSCEAALAIAEHLEK